MLANIAQLEVEPLARLFRALSDETRVRIVALLSHGELCVCHIESALDISQPNASRQLTVLRAAGLVRTRRQGVWMYYSLLKPSDAASRQVLRGLKAFAGTAIRQDLERLRKVKGPGSTCRR